jgi:hypothetical protein
MHTMLKPSMHEPPCTWTELLPSQLHMNRPMSLIANPSQTRDSAILQVHTPWLHIQMCTLLFNHHSLSWVKLDPSAALTCLTLRSTYVPCYAPLELIESNTILNLTAFVALRTSQPLSKSHMEIAILACSSVSTTMLCPMSYTIASYRLTNQITPVTSKDITIHTSLSSTPFDPACNSNWPTRLAVLEARKLLQCKTCILSSPTCYHATENEKLHLSPCSYIIIADPIIVSAPRYHY